MDEIKKKKTLNKKKNIELLRSEIEKQILN
jgi:hypothetical protein